jgi:predicted HicB family RNase H-like nuclease
MKATMFRIEPELHKTLRIAAIEAGISMNEAVKQAVEMWLAKQRKGGKSK